MPGLGRAVWGVCLIAATSAAEPALARDDDLDRQARRHELRQQLQAERERWRSDARGPAAYGATPDARGAVPIDRPSPGAAPLRGYAGPPGYVGPHGYAPHGYVPPGHDAPRYGTPPRDPASGYASHGGPGGPQGWGGGHRLSPEERRALRQELRQHRP